jgi:hypothetical protein
MNRYPNRRSFSSVSNPELAKQTEISTRILAEHPNQFHEIESTITLDVTVQAGFLLASILFLLLSGYSLE